MKVADVFAIFSTPLLEHRCPDKFDLLMIFEKYIDTALHQVHPAGGDVCRAVHGGLGTQNGQPRHLLGAGESEEATKMLQNWRDLEMS